jgi:hypothetical protein
MREPGETNANANESKRDVKSSARLLLQGTAHRAKRHALPRKQDGRLVRQDGNVNSTPNALDGRGPFGVMISTVSSPTSHTSLAPASR